MKRSRLLLSALMFTVAVSCSVEQSVTTRPSPVLVGALLNGDPEGDPDTQVAVRLATNDVNHYLAAIHSRLRIELQVEPSGLDPERAIEGLSRLQRAGAAIVVGPESSPELEAILAMPGQHRSVLISHCSTASSLALVDGAFRLIPSGVSQSRIIARRILASGASRVVLIYRDDVFGRDLAAGLRPELVSRGIAILDEIPYDTATTDFTLVVTRLEALVQANPGCVVQLSAFGPDAATLFERAASIPVLAGVRWFGSDGTAKSLQILESPVAARFALDTAFESPLFSVPLNQKSRAISERVGAASGVEEPQVCSLTAYDAVWLAALTLMANPLGNYDSLVRTLPSTARDYNGASGRILLNATGDREGGVYDIWVERGNGWVVDDRVEDSPKIQ